jgi:hypothetical protein
VTYCVSGVCSWCISFDPLEAKQSMCLYRQLHISFNSQESKQGICLYRRLHISFDPQESKRAMCLYRRLHTSFDPLEAKQGMHLGMALSLAVRHDEYKLFFCVAQKVLTSSHRYCSVDARWLPPYIITNRVPCNNSHHRTHTKYVVIIPTIGLTQNMCSHPNTVSNTGARCCSVAATLCNHKQCLM